ncbi:unnamed protein product [Symbiodinium natans]|uniref:Uncharacterized protein n=1 Tax=Symbiodinium natans TaxID=878477 RepID=A0A812HED2_9DINO|nr:unnamed protein product [Symbiodinium natans]
MRDQATLRTAADMTAMCRNLYTSFYGDPSAESPVIFVTFALETAVGLRVAPVLFGKDADVGSEPPESVAEMRAIWGQADMPGGSSGRGTGAGRAMLKRKSQAPFFQSSSFGMAVAVVVLAVGCVLLMLDYVSPTTKAKAHTLLPLIGNLQKLEAEQKERREELASLLARQPPRPSTKEEADRRALIQANLKSLEELKSDVRVLSAEHEKLQQVHTQPLTTCVSQAGASPGFGAGGFRSYYLAHVAKSLVPAQLPRLYMQFQQHEPPSELRLCQSKAGSFGSYYAAHVAGALGPAELPRLYQQFRTQPKKAKKQRKEQAGGQPSRSPPPFGASGSFGSYYAAHVATALVPAQLPRLYQQFGFQPVEARMQLQEKAGGQPSRSPPFGASGPFGSYYAAHVATALVPAQLPRLYQQFGFQPGVEARTHLEEKAGGQPSRSPPPFGASGSFGSYYAAHVVTALMPAQLPRLYQKFGVQPGVEARTPLQEKAGAGII